MQQLSSFDHQLTTSHPHSQSPEHSSISQIQRSESPEISSFNQFHFRSGSPDIITYPYPLCKTEEERLKAMALKPNQVSQIMYEAGSNPYKLINVDTAPAHYKKAEC